MILTSKTLQKLNEEYQGEFTDGRGTFDQIFNIKQEEGKSLGHNT